MAMVVRPRMTTFSASRIRNSVSVSTLDVASSSTSTRGSNASARANDSSCFWPTDNVAPRSATGVDRPAGMRLTKPQAWTDSSARCTCASSISGCAEPHVGGNRAREQVHVLQHQAEHRPQSSQIQSRMSTPSMVMRPCCTS